MRCRISELLIVWIAAAWLTGCALASAPASTPSKPPPTATFVNTPATPIPLAPRALRPIPTDTGAPTATDTPAPTHTATRWTSPASVQTLAALQAAPVTVTATTPATPTFALSAAAPYVYNIGSASTEIFALGQSLGQRANAFSKVGDSLTVATWVMYPLGWRQARLGQYRHLQPVIDHFAAAFAHVSVAADNGWTSATVLQVGAANPTLCRPDESPLTCEYRLVRPALAVILLGTNDVATLSPDQYRANMGQIVGLSAERGIIPILTTLPPRAGFEFQVDSFNQVLFALSAERGLPLIDYGAAMRTLPNNGLSPDGVHPSWASVEGDWASAANFSPANLQYGYTMRNLTILCGLDAVWRQVSQR